jgi:hypothetical protein
VRWKAQRKKSGDSKKDARFHAIDHCDLVARCGARSKLWAPMLGKKSDYDEWAFCSKCLNTLYWRKK